MAHADARSEIRPARAQRARRVCRRRVDDGSGKPVVVFVHGGGFARGAKRAEGLPFYDNIGLWAVGQDMVGVTLNYRLAPQSTWPSGIEDLTAAVAWLKANIARHGGDPSKIVLWGHSAGAAHVADYVASAAKRNVDAGIAGAVLTSGFYDLGTEVSVWKIYYGEDVATYAERSSLPGLVDDRGAAARQRRRARPRHVPGGNRQARRRASRGRQADRARAPRRGTRTSRRPTPSAPAIDRCRGPCSSSCAA